MRWDNLRPSGNVDDRRGFGGGGLRLAGGGGLGLLVVIGLSLFFGVDPSQLLGPMEGNAPLERTAGPQANDPAFDFARRIVGSAEDVWQPLLQARGARFAPATFTTYDYATPTGCGQ